MNINYINIAQASFIFIVGYILARFSRILSEKLLIKLNIIKYKKLAGQIAFYIVLILFLFSTLDQLGFDLSVLLGAAGIFSVAIGFASQTSASNFISGLFLIFEKVISEGDVIVVDGVTGEVISIDLLSTKIKTADNLFVRIPNETLIKSKLINLSCFSHRRLDLIITVPYEQNLLEIKLLWLEIADEHPLCLKNPAADLMIDAIKQDHVSIMLSVWIEEKFHAKLKNELQQKLLETLVAKDLPLYIPRLNNIEIK